MPDRGQVSAFQQALQNIHPAVNEFVKDAEQFDDLTMMCLEYKGKAPENKREAKDK